MPKTRPPYTPEFRRRLIELVRKGRTPEEVGRQLEPSAQTIRNWLRQADRDAGRRTDGPTTDEQKETSQLSEAVLDDRPKHHASDSHFVGNTNPRSDSYHVGRD